MEKLFLWKKVKTRRQDDQFHHHIILFFSSFTFAQFDAVLFSSFVMADFFLSFIPDSHRSQPTCAPLQFLWTFLRRSRSPLRDLRLLQMAHAGKNAGASACVPTLSWEKRPAPRLTREKERRSGRERVISLGRRVLLQSSQSHHWKPGQWRKLTFLVELTVQGNFCKQKRVSEISRSHWHYTAFENSL